MKKKKLKEKFIVIIFGSTGVGKSSFAEALASNIPSQIVNCDIGQFYAPLTIGTAKPPNWKNATIKHKLFDIITEPIYFNVCEYRKMLFDTIHAIWQENEIPILVGGSGFYLKSLFFPPIAFGERNKLLADTIHCDTKSLWDKLYHIDPQRAVKIAKGDTYRIQRALEIWETTGKKPSAFLPKFDFPSNFLLLCITRERKELYERIDKRLAQMLDDGWIHEVENLRSTTWWNFLKEKKIIGYDVIIDYLEKKESERDILQVIAKIQKKTKNYAKRQITFWKTFSRQVKEAIAAHKQVFNQSEVSSVNVSIIEPDIYIKKLVKRLNLLFE